VAAKEYQVYINFTLHIVTDTDQSLCGVVFLSFSA